MDRADIKALMDPRQKWEAEGGTDAATQHEIDYLCYCLVVKEGYSAAATDAYFGNRSKELHARWLEENRESA
jgi:hypothetical protein